MARRPAKPPKAAYQNRLLAALSSGDLALLTPFLQSVTLDLRQVLEEPDRPFSSAFFVDEGLVSVVAIDSSGRRIEAGIIGREGMTAVSAVLGGDRSPNSTFVQIAGRAQRMPVRRLTEAMRVSPSLHALFLRYAQAFMTQATQTALANGRGKVEERLARWLLMAHDRISDPRLPLTHEFLALMLGVRRPGVTVALHDLEGAGFVRSVRGVVIIRDRRGLEKLASGFYGVAEAELDRLLGARAGR